MTTSQNSEKYLQNLIIAHLVETHKYKNTKSKDFDVSYCMNTKELLLFIQDSQPEMYSFIQTKGEKKFLDIVDDLIKVEGILYVLRKGVMYYDKTISLFYPEPVSSINTLDIERFQKNRFSVTDELIYSSSHTNEIDLVIFVNGLPILSIELKNTFTNQDVTHAIRQYKNDRSSRDKLFHFARLISHFAVDNNAIYLTTELKGEKTNFIPFNKGLNDGKDEPPFGAGNPVNPNGIKTDYFWKDILSPKSLSKIIDKFAVTTTEKNKEAKSVTKKLIFPRYHQLTLVHSLLKDTKENSIGKRYLIQHSAGSGKSNSISWLAYQLAALYDISGKNLIFDSVIVITDRRNLDKQIRETILSFSDGKKGIVEAITGLQSSKTKQLKTALENKKKIIIATVQIFPHLLEEMGELKDRKFAIIIDEAHSTQGGKTAAKMNVVLGSMNENSSTEEIDTEEYINQLIKSKKMLSNANYYAFTATPKDTTLETFGIKKGEKFFAFHTYSMKQAIEEKFILDVLKNYTTYKSYYHIKKKIEENPSFKVRDAQKKIKAYVELREEAIEDKSRIMIDHFQKEVSHRINGRARAMVVTKSIDAAIKYYFAFVKVLKEKKLPYKPIIAFSEKKGLEHTEESLNDFADNNHDIPEQFKKEPYRFLIVAEKYQTGFDEPLLHTMYVDKKLEGVQAVQTLSRLNRAYPPFKEDTFVLDFYNKAEDIKKEFEKYYTTTILSEETDPNDLNVIQRILDKSPIYTNEDLDKFVLQYIKKNREGWEPVIDICTHNFNTEILEEERVEFKSNARKFIGAYDYLSKIIDFGNIYWEKLNLFLSVLIYNLKLKKEKEEDITEKIELEYYKFYDPKNNSIEFFNPENELDGIKFRPGGPPLDEEYDSLETIVDTFNKRFAGYTWEEKNKSTEILAEAIPETLKSDEAALNSVKNSDEANGRKSISEKVFKLIQDYFAESPEVYNKYTENETFKADYDDFIFKTILQATRKNLEEGLAL